MIARVLVVVAAVAGVVVLAGDLRVARDVDRAEGMADRPAEAIALLQRAGARTDDTTPLLREAQLQLLRRQPADALAPAREVTRREPENAQAWLVLAQAAERTGDAALAREARARVSALVARP
jgi:predicted Zn-dependent protease